MMGFHGGMELFVILGGILFLIFVGFIFRLLFGGGRSANKMDRIRELEERVRELESKSEDSKNL